jgi:hypothetical protein
MPYSPNPYAGGDLARYVQDELKKISSEFSNAQGAASLYITTPQAAIAVTPAYVQITSWDGQTPQRDWRGVQPSLPDDAIYVKRVGQVGCSFVLSGLVPNAGGYRAALFVNGVETQLGADVDPSNQTAAGELVAIGTFRIGANAAVVADKFDVRIRTLSGNSTYTLQRAYFSVWWLGD